MTTKEKIKAKIKAKGKKCGKCKKGLFDCGCGGKSGKNCSCPKGKCSC